MLPTASVSGVVFQVAAVAVLLGIALNLVRVYRERGTRSSVGPLERGQEVAIWFGIGGMALSVLTDVEDFASLTVVALVVVIVLAVVRRRRGEPVLPRSLL
ncbi:hypothetical protein [Patulibacter minatonensis]|uniref:hypothetical protein n=1 Tax=Patulibacter minatonensis TaxID=298163 RepID=UPI00047A54B8|nr:hypothetical protein [Patulibacter minatonensis]